MYRLRCDYARPHSAFSRAVRTSKSTRASRPVGQINLLLLEVGEVIGTIIEIDERQRLTVQMDLLNGRVRVSVDARSSAAI